MSLTRPNPISSIPSLYFLFLRNAHSKSYAFVFHFFLHFVSFRPFSHALFILYFVALSRSCAFFLLCFFLDIAVQWLLSFVLGVFYLIFISIVPFVSLFFFALRPLILVFRFFLSLLLSIPHVDKFALALQLIQVECFRLKLFPIPG